MSDIKFVIKIPHKKVSQVLVSWERVNIRQRDMGPSGRQAAAASEKLKKPWGLKKQNKNKKGKRISDLPGLGAMRGASQTFG